MHTNTTTERLAVLGARLDRVSTAYWCAIEVTDELRREGAHAHSIEAAYDRVARLEDLESRCLWLYLEAQAEARAEARAQR
jgi:hypothetical protein